MKRKGILQTASLAVVTLMMVSTLAAVGIQNIVDVGNLIRSETLDMVQSRIETGVYSVDAFEEAQLEMQFDGGSHYLLYSEDNQKYLEFRYGGDSTRIKMDDNLRTNYRIDASKDDSPVDRICISKSNGVVVSLGGC